MDGFVKYPCVLSVITDGCDLYCVKIVSGGEGSDELDDIRDLTLCSLRTQLRDFDLSGPVNVSVSNMGKLMSFWE